MDKIIISPVGSMDLLSQLEVSLLQKKTSSELYPVFKNCALAVLNAGNKYLEINKEKIQTGTFEITIIQTEWGVQLELDNPPESAFVDGKMIYSIRKSLFAVLRDILFVNSMIEFRADKKIVNLTDLIFMILRNANVFKHKSRINQIVCWGGHSINNVEYDYAREVGFELGLRMMNICTGCGAGVMEAPMRGAAIGHTQQCFTEGHFIGLTEPGIISSEPPNTLVTDLVIMPDIEKRLEAFVRLAHGIIIFPGGAGTAEELLYILAIMLHPKNGNQYLPIILTGPKESEEYFTELDRFIEATLGEKAKNLYEIIIDDPILVAQKMVQATEKVNKIRSVFEDSYLFSWTMHIEPDLQHPFNPSHENMAALNLNQDQPDYEFASALRKVFSGIVAGNVKPFGVYQIEKLGPYQIRGDKNVMNKLNALLKSFVVQGRMNLLNKKEYVPCYQIIND